MDYIESIKQTLAAGPTPGPWECRTFQDHDGPPSCDDIQVCADAPCGECNGPLLTMDWRKKPKQCDFPREQAERTAAYIAACHPEAIRSLLDRLREAEAMSLSDRIKRFLANDDKLSHEGYRVVVDVVELIEKVERAAIKESP